ncbi:M3 family oligoendopeptidase [Lichenihabitans sp. Uapishka_5]|uniref:M3 family oligoendopeptidase n=1 Tax=Lichenihabitans sp. Uapishka_5 TaxID=3037302 RepID=UPI0029E80DF0|nr:M3 family oligoendopeptidase [Lichenihabitans sp. Uapishka_5]MDX7949966.1 M3 family oligoendopeptidase [Lichenihabitans sp. Uapishka_5]
MNRFPNVPRSPAAPVAAATDADIGSLPTWDLRDLYAGMGSPDYRADLDATATAARQFAETYRGRLAAMAEAPDAAAQLGVAVASYEAIDDTLGRIISFASLLYAGDTADPQRAKFFGDAQEHVTTVSSDLLFFTLELNRIDDALIDRAALETPLARYRPWLDDLRRDKPFQLEDRVEQLFHEKAATGRAAWIRLFDETITALRFTVNGEDLSLEPTLNLMQDPDQGRRRAAAEALGTTLKAHERTFALVTNTLSKDRDIGDRWRGFTDVADGRHLANRVERDVVDALLQAVQAAYPRLSHRYYAMKARWFGVEQLDYWDRNAPLPQAPDAIAPWGEARDTILDAYRGFSPAMADIAAKFFEGGWIDAPIRPGKAPGAFSHPTTPSAHPYILVNYQGRPRDVMILAHELGHGVHQVLAGPNGALMAPTPLTLAETASVFGEMLTFRSLRAKTTDPRARFSLLASKVEDMLNTVVRQIAFYSFERKLHEERRTGELTVDRIGELWMSVQAESLGPAIRFGPGYETFWSYVPHFIHSPFYVYAYAFGDCLVNSLYGVFERTPEGFAERYLAMLSAGGSKTYTELLTPFGLDAHDPGFWTIGLDLIAGMIDELEAMGSVP